MRAEPNDSQDVQRLIRRVFEDEFLVAHLVGEDDRHPVSRRKLSEETPTLRGLAHVPRRRREVEDELRAAPGQHTDRIAAVADLGAPCVLADREPQRGDGTGCLGREEVALLVEDVVGGEQGLGLLGGATAAAEQDRGVRQVLAVPWLHGQHGTQGDVDLARERQQRIQRAQLVADEALALEQVHRWIAREAQLGSHAELRARREGAAGRLLHQVSIAGEVTHRGVDLRDADPHGARIGGRLRSVKRVPGWSRSGAPSPTRDR